jgi:phospholipid-binding lipoprotein MlaA
MTNEQACYRRGVFISRWLAAFAVLLVVLCTAMFPVSLSATVSDENNVKTGGPSEAIGSPDEVAPQPAATAPQPAATAPQPAATEKKPSDEFGNVTEEQAAGTEEARLADPIEPWNRAMFHFNDKVYFWLLKPVATGYKYALPEDIRGIFSNFYQNIKAPIRIVNNFLQGKPGYAGLELARFLINSTLGVAGFRDYARERYEITGRESDFGQTLGKYGIGFGFYIVWPFLGPSSPRDTIGWVGDLFLTPTSYLSSDMISAETLGLYAHEKVNTTSFHLGDYEALKKSAIDPYVAMRDAYRQYRLKKLQEEPLTEKPNP